MGTQEEVQRREHSNINKRLCGKHQNAMTKPTDNKKRQAHTQEPEN
jgi:hypothetical protein